MEQQSNAVTEYRRKHPRCRYCKYCIMKSIEVPYLIFLYDCVAKGKRLWIDDDFRSNYKGMFCSIFKPENFKQ